MRLLITIPHHYDPSGKGRYGSLREERHVRAASVAGCIRAIHELFGLDQHTTSMIQPRRWAANQATAAHLDVRVCTDQEHHLLNDLPLSPGTFKQHVSSGNPRLLGFECHRLLHQNLGHFDYYGFMEDDLILHDPWFFSKLRWFNEQAGSTCLLQPNRYELSSGPSAGKCYIDGDLREAATSRFQNIEEHPQVILTAMNLAVTCRRTRNPHSGCFFLNREQMEFWSKQPWFLDGDTSFISPLESAATLGIARTFRVYKPSARFANFLEIQHAGDAWTREFDKRVQRRAGDARPSSTQ